MDQSVNPQHHNLPNAPRVGGGCDGCELMYVGMPEEIASSDTSVGWSEAEQKLQVNGTVLKSDGVTPAPNILIYYWHTDKHGNYTALDGIDSHARVHGSLRVG